MTEKKLMELISDMAEDDNMSLDQYVLNLIKGKNDEKLRQSQDLPPEVQEQLLSAQKAKDENRRSKRLIGEKNAMEEDIVLFKEYFPQVSAEDIPEAVWNEVQKGVSLVHAYALYLKIKQDGQDYAENINSGNSVRSVPVDNADDSDDPLSKEEVEGMTPQAVKGNFGRILNSMKKWKL